MSVSTQTFWSTPATANGVTASFSFAFPIANKNDVIPLLDGVAAEGNYTVVLNDVNDYAAGGSVVFDALYKPANGTRVIIIRRMEYTQLTELATGYNASAVEMALDAATMLVQQLAQRALLVPDYSTAEGFDASLPDPADAESGDILVLNDDKDGFEWGGTAYVGPQGPQGDPGADGEVAYATLASTAHNQGASLIGIEDSGGKITATTVEGALAEHATLLSALDQAVILKGTWDASGGSFPGSGSAQAGWSYIVSVGGTVNAVDFAVGDRIIAITDNASTSTYASNWFKADGSDQVSSVAGRTGAVTISVSDLSNSILSAFVGNSITGTITISTSSPSGGSDGDIWLERAA